MSGSNAQASVVAAGTHQGGPDVDPDSHCLERRVGEPGRPTIVYIAGSGRSGSTLVERTLGEMPGFVNVGELIDLFRWTVSRDERCGCGRPFAECAFWAGVGRRAFGGWPSDVLTTVQRLQGRVARQRHTPRLFALSVAGRRFRADVASYGNYYTRLYEAIAGQSGASTIVDASKWPVQALALAHAGIDVRVLHLVRDVRGVAYSLSKHVVRPHAMAEAGRAEAMSRNASASAAARWAACQGQAELLRRRGLPVARVRYEDFVRRPRASIEAALTGLGVPFAPEHLAHVDGRQLALKSSHGLSGNPSRFREGPVTLVADEAWRDRMPARDRFVTTAIGLPLLLRYRGAGSRAQRRADASVNQALSSPHQHDRPSPQQHDWPLVSVIVPTRGRPGLVRKSIAAVVAQTYPGDIECFVVHDQEPPDEALAGLAAAQRQVRVLANTHAPGLAGARNTGLDVVRGDYVATCDDDDVWHPEKLQVQMTRLLSDPGLLVVGSGIRLQLPARVIEWPGRAEEISYQLLLRNRVKELHSSTLVIRREAFDKAGRYDEELPHGYGEDYDWILRAAKAGRVGLVTRPLADIRKDAGSWYQGSPERAAALAFMLAKHPDIAACPRGHARMLGQIAFTRSSLGEHGPAVRYAMKALRRWPLSPYPYMALVHSAIRIDPRHLLRMARLLRRGMA
jgi:Glycosyl transferase family 2/Sulfotransferase family